MDQTVLPEQKDPRASFGDPPITLYTAPRFHVDVYFWFEGTTAIHQHGFAGPFQVLHGSSIHSWYEWERREVVNTFTETGDMTLKVCELSRGGRHTADLGREAVYTLTVSPGPAVGDHRRTH